MSTEVNVVVIGAAGRMGRSIVRYIQAGAVPGLKLVGAVDIWDCPERGRDVGIVAGVAEMGVKIGTDLLTVLPAADVVIDFSGHHGTVGNAPRVAAKRWSSARRDWMRRGRRSSPRRRGECRWSWRRI